MTTIALDLGSGAKPNNYFHADVCIGLDLIDVPGAQVIKCNLFEGELPFSSNSVDYVTAFDFLEHLPRTYTKLHPFPNTVNSFILLMNEVSRVLVQGGKFFHRTPVFPHPEAFTDPTHVNIITEATMFYFAKVPSGPNLIDPDITDDAWSFVKPLATSYGIMTSLTLTESYKDSFYLCQLFAKS